MNNETSARFYSDYAYMEGVSISMHSPEVVVSDADEEERKEDAQLIANRRVAKYEEAD